MTTPGTPTPAQTAMLRRRLVDLLVQAFPNRSDVSLLTDFYLNTSLALIPTDGSDLRSLFNGIVTWCLSQTGDALGQLLDGAIQERPARADLKAMRADLVAAGLIGGSAGAGPAAGSSGAATGTGSSTQAAPSESTASTPVLAVLDNGQLSLTATGRAVFNRALMGVVWTQTGDGRSNLLSNLPALLRAQLTRSADQTTDLSAIVNAAEAWGKMSGGQFAGKYALIVLAETAAQLAGYGQPGAPAQADTFMQLANAMRAVVGQAQATAPLAD